MGCTEQFVRYLIYVVSFVASDIMEARAHFITLPLFSKFFGYLTVASDVVVP